MTALLALALLAASPPRLAVIDRAIAAQSAALAQAYAPLMPLAAAAERLARTPPAVLLMAPARRDRLVRIRVLAALLGRQIDAQVAGRRHALAGLAALRLRLTGTLPPLPGWSPVYRLPLRAHGVVTGPDPADLALAAAPGAAVIAPAAGMLAYAGPFRRYGSVVIIDHGHGWTSILTGIGATGPSAGRYVAAGALLGHMGRAMPVLVLELRHHGHPVDVARMAALPG